MGLDSLYDKERAEWGDPDAALEFDYFFDAKGTPVLPSPQAQLELLSHDIAEKAYRAEVHKEAITTEWLLTTNEELLRILRIMKSKTP